MAAYEPRGKVKLLADAMAADPQRIWSSPEVAKVMDVHQGALTAHLDTAVRHGLVYRQLVNGKCQYSPKPFPAPVPTFTKAAAAAAADAVEAAPKHARSPGANGFIPAPMIAPRPGSDIPAPSRAHGQPPAPAASDEPRLRIVNHAPAPVVVTEKARPRGERLLAVEEAPASGAAPEVITVTGLREPAPDTSHEVEEEGEPEEIIPDAFYSCRTGEIVLVGLEADEDGRVTIPADLVLNIRRAVAWAPPPREAL